MKKKWVLRKNDEENGEKEKQECSAIMGKNKNKSSFYAKEREVKSAYIPSKPMIVFFYTKRPPFSIIDIDSSLPSVAIFLFLENKDVFPKDMLQGLPPIWGIEHQIDFIPGASIPNKLAYRSSLEETNELQW